MVGEWSRMIVVVNVICLQALEDSVGSRMVNSETFNILTLNCQNLSFKVKVKYSFARHFNFNFTLL
jgi:hypothetical protein